MLVWLTKFMATLNPQEVSEGYHIMQDFLRCRPLRKKWPLSSNSDPRSRLLTHIWLTMGGNGYASWILMETQRGSGKVWEGQTAIQVLVYRQGWTANKAFTILFLMNKSESYASIARTWAKRSGIFFQLLASLLHKHGEGVILDSQDALYTQVIYFFSLLYLLLFHLCRTVLFAK